MRSNAGPSPQGPWPCRTIAAAATGEAARRTLQPSPHKTPAASAPMAAHKPTLTGGMKRASTHLAEVELEAGAVLANLRLGAPLTRQHLHLKNPELALDASNLVDHSAQPWVLVQNDLQRLRTAALKTKALRDLSRASQVSMSHHRRTWPIRCL